MQSTHCILMAFLTRYISHVDFCIKLNFERDTRESFAKLENVDFQGNLMEVESNMANKHSAEAIAVEEDFIDGANHARSYKQHIDKLISGALINGIAAWYVLKLMRNILHSFMFVFLSTIHICTYWRLVRFTSLLWKRALLFSGNSKLSTWLAM